MVGLQEKRHDLVRRLSGGQRQRLLIGVALVSNPRILFLDEPTGSLDPHARRQLWEVILRQRAEGRTIVLTTHYMEEAEAPGPAPGADGRPRRGGRPQGNGLPGPGAHHPARPGPEGAPRWQLPDPAFGPAGGAGDPGRRLPAADGPGSPRAGFDQAPGRRGRVGR
nr:MAG: hypothetical protein DIU70_04560 [Bacillota bacterium]